jgi:LysM repeat protein
MKKFIAPITFLLVFSLAACNFPLFKGNGSTNASATPFIFYITATPGPSTTSPVANTTIQPFSLKDGVFSYPAQSGDTLEAVARHFGVPASEITSIEPISQFGVLTPGQVLAIPNVLKGEFISSNLIPDSEVVFSPTATDFDIKAFIDSKGGFLSIYTEKVDEEYLTGVQIVERIAYSNSINPRLLLALIEYRSHWLTQTPVEPEIISPLGFFYKDHQGLYLECALMAKWVNTGYYGWRQGAFTELNFKDNSVRRVEPQLNAGTVALQYFFSQIVLPVDWNMALNSETGLLATYRELFGDPWQRSATVSPMITPDLVQPELELPFTPGEVWALTGGSHYDWNAGTPSGALDFAPISGEAPCQVSRTWVLAPAAGRIAYSGFNFVVMDVYDSEGNPTGWQIFFMHIARWEAIETGTMVSLNDHIGHPSCEGGDATGTHVHMARRYMGEWLGTGYPIPFIMSGWTALPGEQNYLGTLVKGDQVVKATTYAGRESYIVR